MQYFILNLLAMPRIYKQLVMLVTDSILLILILLMSFSIRLGYLYLPAENLFLVIYGAPLIGIIIFYLFGLYSSVVRYTGFKNIASVIQAVTIYALIWALICYVNNIVGVPRSVIFFNWMLSILVISGIRVVASSILVPKNKTQNNIIIYGSGEFGLQLASALKFSSNYRLIAFVDDNKVKSGRSINGIRVFTSKELSKLIKKFDVSEVFVTLSDISRKNRNKIVEDLSILPVKVSVLPGVSELADGKVRVNDLREVDIKDLLGREPVRPNKSLLRVNIMNKVVLVTGAGGSIGSELCRQILLLNPKKLILFELSEVALYQIEQELINLNISNIEIFPILGSISDYERIKAVLDFYKVETIYHAAAYKHVPLVEYNKSAGVLNNAIGTMKVAEAAISSNIETFVLISTDKAVRPTNTMGASKRIAELILQAFSALNHNTCFTMVRFGNVLDSSGSVIPLFKKQIKDGGPVTVTHPHVVRYFMTIPEAVELVIQSGAMAEGGEVFVLDMGEPVKIYDLAVKIIQLSGLKVKSNIDADGDIEIKLVGLRPGEKLYEELLVGDNVQKTDHELIMRANEQMIDWSVLNPILNDLEKFSISGDQKKIRELIIKIVPQFKPQLLNVDLLSKK